MVRGPDVRLDLEGGARQTRGTLLEVAVPVMPSLRRRDPWWGADGTGAVRRRRRQRVVAFMALMLSLGAVGGAALAWVVELGFGGVLGFPGA